MTTVLAGVPTYSHHSNKIAKPRGKMVKPILKKVIPQSPKNSLDLDRGWDDQTADFGCGGIYESAPTSTTRSARDVSFPRTPWEPSGYTSAPRSTPSASEMVSPIGGGESVASIARSINNRGRFQQHARSTSGTSIATNSSSNHHRPGYTGAGGGGGGSFVHPFQQTPRTSTPPVTYANSFTSFERDNNMPRDYSPTVITENEDDEIETEIGLPRSTSLPQSLSLSAHPNQRPPPSINSHSTASLTRRPSLTSQRTSSLTDLNNDVNVTRPPLRVNTLPIRRSHPHPQPQSPPPPARAAHGSINTPSFSNSDLQLNTTSSADSPRPSLTLATPTPTPSTGPMSPIRTSLEGAFRLRSRSEIDTGARREDIREARRKFEEAERLKQEKYESEQRKKRERKDSKMEKVVGRPSFSRKRTSEANTITDTRHTKSVEILRPETINEKVQRPGSAFMSRTYESTEGGVEPSLVPDVADVRFEAPKRASGAKRRTQSYWTRFILWLRTRLLKLGRR